jgi:hypothetical protein
MAKQPRIELEQINQAIDCLISQLIEFKATVAELRLKVEGLEVPTDDKQRHLDALFAHVLNKREKVIQRRIEKAQNSNNKK